VALVFNPRTGRVSPQYHVVFNDTFSTVPYMDAGTVPPHWEDLLKHSSEKATDEEFSLTEDGMDLIKKMPGDQSNVTAGSRITDPFAVVTKILTSHLQMPPGQHTHHKISPPKHAECKLPGRRQVHIAIFGFIVECCSKFGLKAKKVTPHR
jgi:hypothetical protein